MSFGQYIIGFIFLVVAYLISIFGFCQIVGSPFIYTSRAKTIPYESFIIRLKKSLIPFITWVIILGGISTIVLWLFPNYKVFFFIGYIISFVISLFNIGRLKKEAMQNTQSEQSNKNKGFCLQYMRFGISCFSSIQIPNEWHFEKTNSANYLAVNKQGDMMMFQFMSYKAIIDSGNTIDSYKTELASDFAKLGFNDFTIFETKNYKGKLFTLNEKNTIEKILLIESDNGFFSAISNFSNSFSEEEIESILKTLSVDDSEVEKDI